MDVHTGTELLVTLFIYLVFWRTSILFSPVAAPIYIPTNSECTFLHIFSNICYLWSFDDTIYDKCEMIPHLICTSLTISNAEHLLCLLTIYMSSLGKKCLFRSSAYFKKNIYVYELFIYFGYYLSYHLQIFSPIY